MKTDKCRVGSSTTNGRRDPLPGLILSDDWRKWIVENLLGGSTSDAIVTGLVGYGIPEAVAFREVVGIEKSPALVSATHWRKRAKQLDQVCRLSAHFARTRTNPLTVEVRVALSGEEFYDRYYARSTPVVMPNFSRGWRALALWSPEYFRDQFGDADVEVCTRRDADPDCDAKFLDHVEAMTMRTFAERVIGADLSNDIYMVAHNNAIRREPLRALLNDVEQPVDFVDPKNAECASSIWFGPGGTKTPLHHDPTNVLFTQVYGSKRFRLVAPYETALLDAARGFYNSCNLNEAPDILVSEVVLNAGDTLFIPTGWYHQVESLSTSISFSLMNFRRPNDATWYCPGKL